MLALVRTACNLHVTKPLTSPLKFAECAFLKIRTAVWTKTIHQCIANSIQRRSAAISSATSFAEFVHFGAV